MPLASSCDSSNGEQDSRWTRCLRSTCGPLASAAVAALAFATATEGDLVFDDAYAIVQNADVFPTSPWWRLWVHDYWGFPLRSRQSHKSYRPLTTLTFRWQILASGGALDAGTVASLHVVNVLLHCTNSALLALVCQFSFGMSALEAGVAGVLFAAHPVHVEAVANVVGRAELLACLCVLLSLLTCFDGGVGRLGRLRYAGALSLVAAALFCKETAAGAVPLLVALALLRSASKQLADVAEQKAPSGKSAAGVASLSFSSFIYLLGQIVFAALGWFLLLLGRVWLHGGLAAKPFLHPEANPGAFASDWTTRALTLHLYFARHLALLVAPGACSLCCDWSHASIPLVTSLADPRAFAALLAIYLPLTAVAAVLARSLASTWHLRSQRGFAALLSDLLRLLERRRAEVAHFLIFALFILPSSNVLFPVGFALAERVLYLPSVGVCGGAALAFSALLRWADAAGPSAAGPARLLLFAALAAAVAAGAWRSAVRSREWHSAEALYRSGVAVNPGNEKLRDLLATRLHNAGRGAQEAADHALQAIAINPTYWHAHATLGQIRSAGGDAAGAAASYRTSLALAEAQHLDDVADAPKVRLNLAMMLQDSAPAEAEAHFRRVVGVPGGGGLTSTAHVVFGAFLESTSSGRVSRLEEATSSYRKALSAAGVAACEDVAHLRLGSVLARRLRLAEADLAQRAASSALPAFSSSAAAAVGVQYGDSAQSAAPSTAFARSSVEGGSACDRHSGASKASTELDLVVLRGVEASEEADTLLERVGCAVQRGLSSTGMIWAFLRESSAAAALQRALLALQAELHGEERGIPGHDRDAAAATATLPPPVVPEEILRHLRRGLAVRQTAESAALDPGGQRRAQALALVSARLSAAGRLQEAAPYLRSVHADPALALVALGHERLGAGDVASAYEAHSASLQLRESREAHAGLARALELAGDAATAARHRQRLEALAAPAPQKSQQKTASARRDGGAGGGRRKRRRAAAP
eukprot:TRINITY_DN27942_c0_g2_i1.p1 TRINITY_DN27942_c0_g2~~TRINITY_DN27942_c0_g2_i1.p1  ORF type:complete len:1012 (+),score=235.49 TRINITY_DN27942_c0_g2_i1:63-3038(+)